MATLRLYEYYSQCFQGSCGLSSIIDDVVETMFGGLACKVVLISVADGNTLKGEGCNGKHIIVALSVSEARPEDGSCPDNHSELVLKWGIVG